MCRGLFNSVLCFILLAGQAASSSLLDSGSTANPDADSCYLWVDDPFTSDPFTGGAWTISNDDTDCPVTWSAGAIRRDRPGIPGCDNTTALVRLNTQTSQDSCAIYQMTDNDPGTLGSSTWEVGMVARHQTGDAGVGRHYIARCEVGLPCGTLRFGTDVATVNDCSTFGSVSIDGWVGMCIRGVGADTVTRIWNLGASDPGSPADAQGSGWGAPECVFNGCPFGGIDCDDVGSRWGIWLRSNAPNTLGVLVADNFRAYVCGGGEGPAIDTCVLPAELSCQLQ